MQVHDVACRFQESLCHRVEQRAVLLPARHRCGLQSACSTSCCHALYLYRDWTACRTWTLTIAPSQ